jgi:4-hydroxy-tetrahydrodipicolinate synthase
MTATDASRIGGVYPIVATPFTPEGAADTADLAGLVDFLVDAGVDGIVFPGVASEFETLADAERRTLVECVARANRRRVPLVVGASASDARIAAALAAHARTAGATAVMAMAPAALRDDPEGLVAFFRAVAAAGLPVILQNAPPPLGAALSPEQVAAIVDAVPGVRYVKEEVLPCGQRITRLLALAPRGLAGVFGGAGGRYITDELARGACGTMPASELADLHVRQYALHRKGDAAGVRALFDRMLPLLNFQAVFRMAMTKEVLRRRGVIRSTHVRSAGPLLDEGDRRELDALMEGIADLLPAHTATRAT